MSDLFGPPMDPPDSWDESERAELDRETEREAEARADEDERIEAALSACHRCGAPITVSTEASGLCLWCQADDQDTDPMIGPELGGEG